MSRAIVNTKEKDRQSQVLCVFALVRVLTQGWQTLTEVRFGLAKAGYPRCSRTVRRLFRTLDAAGIELLVNRKSTPYRFRVRKSRPFA